MVSSVIVGPDAIYASSENEAVAVAPDGSDRWRSSPGGGLYYVAGRLYVSADGPIIALDADTGDGIWRTELDGFYPGDVHEVAGTIYVTGRESVRGLHADTGQRRWQLTTARYPALVASEDVLAVATHERVRRVAPGETTDGLTRDPAPNVTETIRTGWRTGTMPPSLDGRVLFVPQYGQRGHVTTGAVRKYGLEHGDERWMTPFTWRGVGSASISPETVFVAPFRATTDPPDGSLVALGRETGGERWRYDGTMLGRPAVGDDVVVTGAADPGSPSPRVSTDGSREENGASGRSPSPSGVLHGFDVDSGTRLWTITPGHSFGGYPTALAGDRIYYGDEHGLHAVS